MTLNDVRDRATTTPEEAADLLGMGMRQTYAALKDGSLPSIRLSRRYLVPVPALLRLLGEDS
ncbi:helix-turn-helix domain-containing protein [Leifsonia sp. AG29]|uniref:helix-turn-helix domain-containing protein n=1 Tax=Leifsonia sp. AG29 TaxID=2598860 RepID=UPI00131A7F64|nr:helix-turn-helix domain-containing protein [Leifsonia sp. AG29]